MVGLYDQSQLIAAGVSPAIDTFASVLFGTTRTEDKRFATEWESGERSSDGSVVSRSVSPSTSNPTPTNSMYIVRIRSLRLR